jgi:hypothetical protein
MSDCKSNRELLTDLIESRSIRVLRGGLFNTAPARLPDQFDFDKVEGMMLGVAVGDSLGLTSEGLTPAKRLALFGEIRDLPHAADRDGPFGSFTDDTQLSFWTLEQMLAAGKFVPESVARLFASRRISGIGMTVAKFLLNLRSGKPWYESGPESAGNGALMRMTPMVIPHLKTPSTNLWIDTALSAMMTHNDRGSISACLVHVKMLWDLLGMTQAPEPTWWLETYVETAWDLEGDISYRPRSPEIPLFRGSIWEFVDSATPTIPRKRSSGPSTTPVITTPSQPSWVVRSVRCMENRPFRSDGSRYGRIEPIRTLIKRSLIC